MASPYVFSSARASHASPSGSQRSLPKYKASSVDAFEDEGHITEMAFLRWKVELQNRLIVEQEKRSAEQRKAYKDREDSKFWERKQHLHQNTIKEFHHSNEMVDAHHKSNQERGLEYKQDLAVMRNMIAQQKEEWRQFGHELTVQHGTEQQERTRARVAESAEGKAAQGREVKATVDEQNRQIRTQREIHGVEKHKHVEELKADKIGKLEESLTWMYEQKKGMVNAVRRIEDKWKALTKTERDAFLSHAVDNHQNIDFTKEHMREARKNLIKKNRASAETERRKKMEDAMTITEKREKYDGAKRAQRDATYSARFASPDKSRVMRTANRSPSPQKAARDAGLIISPEPPDPSSPYRLA